MSGDPKDEVHISTSRILPGALFPKVCPTPGIRVPDELLQNPREKELFSYVCSSIQPSSILEVGSWLGASALGWKKTSIELNQTSQIYCIDTWLGSPEHFLETHGKDWNKNNLLINEKGPQFFEAFLTNIHHWGYSESIHPMRADSQSALRYLAAKKALFDVVYIDGAHDEISVFKDVTQGFRVLKKGGILCGDDFGWPSVRTGLFLALSDNSLPNLKVMSRGGDFVIIPPKNEDLIDFFQSKGFTIWEPLREQISTITKFCLKKTGWAFLKRAGFTWPN